MVTARMLLPAIAILALAPGCRTDKQVGDYPPDAAPGPACNCDHNLPLCVGVSWTHDVHDPENGGFLFVKTLEIDGFEEMSDDQLLADHRGIFHQVRYTPNLIRSSWLTRDGGRVLWLKDEYRSRPDGALVTTRYFVPGKIRVDDDHLVDGEAFPEEYDEITTTYDTGAPVTVMYHHTVTWTTSYEDTPNGWINALCQHKLDSSPEGGGVITNANYCFVPGVGKVYEQTVNEAEENLTAWNIPGCGTGP